MFDGIDFRQYSEDRHMLYTIVNTGQKICGTKFLLINVRDKVAKLVKIFSWRKFPSIQ